MTGPLRTLAVLSAPELVSALAPLVNLATVHDDIVASVLGPAHGALHLAVVVTALLGRDLTRRTRVGALVPVLSGPLTVGGRRGWSILPGRSAARRHAGRGPGIGDRKSSEQRLSDDDMNSPVWRSVTDFDRFDSVSC